MEFGKVIYLTNEPLLSTRRSIDVGLLGENYHQINLIADESLLLNEDVVFLL